MGWMQNLQRRWKARSLWQVINILLAFACTGLTVVWLMRPALHFLFGHPIPGWAKAVYYLVILPIYNLVLLFYGFLFGQFRFFLEFEKRSFRRLMSLFARK
jgi:hypothetical protein